ncbi:TRAP transporter small permease subunit [bacterium]|nr:TRAP transporter small permease subunit [bacterium]
MVLTVTYDVIMRYGFKSGNIAVQEMEWHLFAVIFLLGAAYSLKKDAHVRVDIIYTKLSTKQKAWIDFIGTFIFLIPFSIIIIYSTRNFIESSWAVGEVSPDPGGLPARYVLKAMIPAGFILLLLQGISQAIKNLMVITGQEKEVAK